MPYQVFVITGSPLAVGLIGLFQAIPLIGLSLVGGVVADAVDRRRMLLATQCGLMLTSLALALATQLGAASVPLLYVLTAVGAAFSALDGPARSSLAPTLVERRQIPAAIALNQTLFQTAVVVGPLAAGIVIGAFGLAAAYWIDVATFLASIAAVALMRRTARAPSERVPPLRAVAEGLAYVRSRRILLAPMALDFFATLFGSPVALLPYYAERVFAVGPEGLGLLYAAMGVGSLAAALASTVLTRIQRQGMAILVAVAVWGLAIAAFGVLGEAAFALALLLLAVAAGADQVSAFFRSTILQLEAPDALRGRLTSINFMFVIGGPHLGRVESGVVAALWSVEAAVISGGLLCLVAVGATAAAAPEVPAYRTAPHEDERSADPGPAK